MSKVTVHPDLDESLPHPPLGRWRRGMARALIVAPILCIGLWFWWDYESRRRLQACIAEIRAAGEPVELGDFVRAPVADERNAAIFLRAAHEALRLRERVPPKPQEASTSWQLDGWVEDPTRLENVDRESGRTWLQLNEDALARYDEALERSDADWGERLTYPIENGMFAHLTSQRELARFVSAAASLHLERGREAEGLHLLSRLLQHARTMEASAPLLLSHLVGISFQRMAIDALRRQECRLLLQAPPARAAARRLIELLLDEDWLRKSHLRTHLGERAFVLGELQGVLKGRAPFNDPSLMLLSFARPVWPLVRLDAVEQVRRFREWIVPGDHPNFVYALGTAPRLPAYKGRRALIHAFGAQLFSGYSFVRSHERSTIVGARELALLLAARLFESEMGRRPVNVDELVPDYLPFAPADPNDPAGRPVEFLPIDEEPD